MNWIAQGEPRASEMISKPDGAKQASGFSGLGWEGGRGISTTGGERNVEKGKGVFFFFSSCEKYRVYWGVREVGLRRRKKKNYLREGGGGGGRRREEKQCGKSRGSYGWDFIKVSCKLIREMSSSPPGGAFFPTNSWTNNSFFLSVC